MDTLTRMRAFLLVVEAEGFSAAARKGGRSKALLSKYVRELEDELGVLLINRTTRRLSLTEAGSTYYQRAGELVREIDQLSDVIRDSSGDLRGRLKISAPRTFGDADIGRALTDFALSHPDVTLDIHLDDRLVDLVDEGYDIAIRITKMADSGLIARRIAPFRLTLCATPELVAQYGKPEHPRDLQNKPCVIDTNARYRYNWPFVEPDGSGSIAVTVSGRFEVNSPMNVRTAALAGLGFAIIPDFIAAPALENGTLVAMLDEFIDNDRGIYAVYPHKRLLPLKVRALVDFLAQWFKDHYNVTEA